MCPRTLHNTIAFQITVEMKKMYLFIVFVVQRSISEERVVLEVSQRVENISRGERGRAEGRGKEF